MSTLATLLSANFLRSGKSLKAAFWREVILRKGEGRWVGRHVRGERRCSPQCTEHNVNVHRSYGYVYVYIHVHVHACIISAVGMVHVHVHVDVLTCYSVRQSSHGR